MFGSRKQVQIASVSCGNGSIASRMWEPFDRACYCPIVYNSLEAFKEEMGFKR